MRRQGWLLAVAAGLCNGLVPACSHLATNAGSAGPAQAAAKKGDDAPPASKQDSPYHALAGTGRDEGPSIIKPVFYQAPAVERPEPPPLPPLPPPEELT